MQVIKLTLPFLFMSIHPLKKILAPLVGLVLVAATATACGSDDDGASGATDNLPAGEGTTEYPLDLETEYGTTTLEERPDRVVAYGGLGPELALSLGITPVASNDWEQFSSFLADHGAGDIGTILEPVDGNVPVEAISAEEPDLILVNTTEQTDVDQLSEVAPVLAYGYSWGPDGTDWREQLEKLGEATDLAGAAADVEKTHDESLGAIREDHPEYADHTANFISDRGGQVNVEAYTGSPAEEFFVQLGFRPFGKAEEFSDTETVSGERFADLDADVIFIYDPSDGTPTLSGSDAFQNLDAVKNDLAFPLTPSDDDPFPGTLAVGLRDPAPLTDVWLAENIEELLGDRLA